MTLSPPPRNQEELWEGRKGYRDGWKRKRKGVRGMKREAERHRMRDRQEKSHGALVP